MKLSMKLQYTRIGDMTVQVFLHSFLTEPQVHTDLPTCQGAKAATSNVENKSTQRELLEKQRA